ncbi:MAG: T9SS type A sorting domain-containing protein, partial [Saprospiraceae bacterium]
SIGSTNVNLIPNTDPQNELFYKAQIPNGLFAVEPVLSFDTPLKNGRYLSAFGNNNEGIYQLAMMPQTEGAANSPQKVAILLDYDPSGGSTTPFQNILEITKFQMLNHFRPIDSFNIIYSNIPIKRVSEKWMPATIANINAAFSNISTSNFSNLATLVTDAIDFCKENGNNGSILLISNSGQYYTNEAATGIHDFIINQMGNTRPQVHIMDYRYSFSPSALIGGVWNYGNSYMNFRLAQSTLGSVVSVRELSVDKAMSSAFESAYYNQIENIDFYTSVENGFCFGRYFISNTANQYANKPILQIGRYHGSFPLSVETAGSLNGNIFFNEQQIPESEIIPGDSLCREMWYGKKLQELEALPNSNNVILDIIQNSLEERVLSKYTAFLCLEDTSQICEDCFDETQYTDTENPESIADSLITAFPNPFSDQVLITVNLDPLKSKSTRTYLEIYNLSGQLVQQFESQTSNSAGPINYRWDGTNTLGNPVTAGVYILMVKSGEWSQVMKLIKQ